MPTRPTCSPSTDWSSIIDDVDTGDKPEIPESESRGQRRRREAAVANRKKTLATREFVGDTLQVYHNRQISPILMEMLEDITYLKMWPWQKLWFHVLRVWGWWLKRWLRIRRRGYIWRWNRMNKAVTERKAAGATIEEDVP